MKGALLMANDNQIAFLCSRLKELREKNGCTMDDMAKKIDVLEGFRNYQKKRNIKLELNTQNILML